MAPQTAPGASALDQFRYAFYQAPPISRTLTAAIVIISWSCMIFRILPFGWLYFDPRLVFSWKPQIWRLVTPFFVSGSGLSLLLDPYFFFHYCSLMEKDSPRFVLAGDMPMFFIFVGFLSMAVSNYVLGSMLFLSHITMSLVYMYAQDEPEQIITFIVIKVRRKYLPFCMLIITLLLGGPIAMFNETFGLISAHAYHFLTKLWPEYGGGRDLVPTPAVFRRWFARSAGMSTQRRYGTAFQARDARSGTTASSNGNASGSWTSGFTNGGSWGSRGQGRRLGGD